jgi:hypothetical protein
VGIVARISDLPIALRIRYRSSTILARNLTVGRCVSERRKLRSNAARVGGRRPALRIAWLTIDLLGLSVLAVSFLFRFALVLLLFLSGLPFLSDFLEFYDGMG